MPITLQRRRKNVYKGSLTIDTFKGIDKSTARHRLPSEGTRLYEAKNIFPYIQGRLMRRKDYVATNSRAADAAFPSFPAQVVIGNAVVKTIVEYRDVICIFYEDDGDTGKLMMDSFDPAANSITGRLTKAMGFTLTANGDVFAVVFNNVQAVDRDWLVVSAKGILPRYIDRNWALDSAGAVGGGWTAGNGMCEVFLQCFFHVFDTNDYTSRIMRAAPGTFATPVAYNLVEDVGSIIKLVSFGYQTSAEGAYTNLVAFKPTSTWLLTSVSTDAVLEQIDYNTGLAGKNAVARAGKRGLVFVGRDKDGLLGLYLLDRTSLTLHDISHELYETLNNIPKANYNDIIVSYHRNRMVRIALTQTGDANANMQEYWIDLYNGIKNRTVWGPFPTGVQSISHVIEFSGGNTPANAGYFFLEKVGTDYLIREEANTDMYQASFSNTDAQVVRTALFDFGIKYGIIPSVWITILENGAKFKVYSEVTKPGGTDDDTTQTLIGNGSYGVTGEYQAGIGGTHTGSNNASVLTDSTKNWNVNGLVGRTIYNKTDGSSAIITANTATTVTGTLAGGTQNDWDTGDVYTIVRGIYVTVPVRITPALRVKQCGFMIESNSDIVNNDPIEPSQIGFDFINTERAVIQ